MEEGQVLTERPTMNQRSRAGSQVGSCVSSLNYGSALNRRVLGHAIV